MEAFGINSHDDEDEEEGNCECCCVYFQDSFDSDDELDEEKWTQDAGDWEKTGGKLQTEDADARITATEENPDGVRPVYVLARGKATAAGDEILLHTNDGLIWFQLKYSTSTGLLTLHTTTGESTMEYDLVEGTEVKLGMCIVQDEDDNFYAVGTINGLNKLSKATAFTSTKSGVGTGSLTGTATFDNFSISRTDEDAEACGSCERAEFACECKDNPPPEQLMLVYTDHRPCNCQKCSGPEEVNCVPSAGTTCYDASGVYYLDPVEGVPCCYESEHLGLEPFLCDDDNPATGPLFPGGPPVSNCMCGDHGADDDPTCGPCFVTQRWTFCLDDLFLSRGFFLEPDDDACNSWSYTFPDDPEWTFLAGDSAVITRVPAP